MATTIYTSDGTEYRTNPRDRRSVERRLPSGRWQVVEVCSTPQDATAKLFKLRSAAEKARATHP